MWFFCFVFTGFYTASYSQPAGDADRYVIDEYFKDGPGVNATSRLSLFSDSTFIQELKVVSCVERITAGSYIKGKYFIKGSKLLLSPESIIEEDFKGHLKKYNKGDTLWNLNFFQKEYTIINYNSLSILIAGDRDFIEIVNGLNETDSSAYIGDLFKNNGYASEYVYRDIKDNLPDLWKDYILKSPVRCNVISMRIPDDAEKQTSTVLRYAGRVYVLDAGTDMGLKEGMALYPDSKSSGTCNIIVFKTQKGQSEAFEPEYFNEFCSEYKNFCTRANR